jgi:hypothetical protein
MDFQVAYRIGRRPRWWTHSATGVLSTSDTGLRIDGPVPYCARYSDIRWLTATNRAGYFYIAIGSSPPIFVTPIIRSLFGFIHIVCRSLNEALCTELRRRAVGLIHCSECGSEARLSAGPCPQCAAGGCAADGSPGWFRLLIACVAVLVLLFAAYVGSYYHLSRRGMREAKAYGMSGFFYAPAEEVIQTRDLSQHYARARLFAPLNCVDRFLFGAQGPVRCVLWGLSKQRNESVDPAETNGIGPE